MSSNPQPLPPGLDSLTREELPKMPKAVADALDDWIMRRFGKESSHHGAGLFLNLLAEEGYEVTPQASSAERYEEEDGSLRSGPSASGPQWAVLRPDDHNIYMTESSARRVLMFLGEDGEVGYRLYEVREVP